MKNLRYKTEEAIPKNYKDKNGDGEPIHSNFYPLTARTISRMNIKDLNPRKKPRFLMVCEIRGEIRTPHTP